MLKTVIEVLSLSPLWQWLSLSQKKDAVRYVIARSAITAAEARHGRKISSEGAIIDNKVRKTLGYQRRADQQGSQEEQSKHYSH
jgi:hypothetical protein